MPFTEKIRVTEDTVKGIENDYLVSRVLKITLHHGQLI